MRILAITHNFPNEGNREHGIFAARQLVEMKQQGADITVLTPVVWCPGFLRNFKRWRNYNHHWKCEYDGIQAITAPYLRLPGKWYRSWAERKVFRAIRDKAVGLHRSRPFDVIYARFLYPEGYATMRLSKILQIPAVGVAAGSEINLIPSQSHRFKRRLIRILRELDGILASGPAVANKIQTMSNREALPVHGVVDLQEFSPVADKSAVRKGLGLPLDKFIVLYVGGLHALKGVYELLDASIGVQKKAPNTVVKILGSGRQERRMREVIQRENASGPIEIVGRIDPQEVHKWMQSSDMLVLPSYQEGMPNVVMEAMACGLPVIASAVGGLPQEVGDCEGVILIQPKNVDELQHAMLRVIRDDALRARMQSASRQRAEQKFGVQRNARIVLDFLQEIVQKHSNSHET